MKKKIVYLVLILCFLLSGCKRETERYVVDIKIDLSPIKRDLYDGAIVQIKDKANVITVPLELNQSLGSVKNLQLPSGIYTLTVTFFAGTNQIYRCPVNEMLPIKQGYILPPVFSLLIDDDEQKLFPVVIGPLLSSTGEKVTLDGSLSRGNSELTYTWSVNKKPKNSDLPEILGTGSRIELELNQIGTYEFVLTIEDGVNREFIIHEVDVADGWLTFGEPIIDIVAIANNSLAILHGLPSKLSIYNSIGMRTIDINDDCFKLAATKKSNIIAALSNSSVYIFDLANLEIIDQTNDFAMQGTIAITDKNHVFMGVNDGYAGSKLTYWTFEQGFVANNNALVSSYDQLFSVGERLFSVNPNDILEYFLDETGLPTGKCNMTIVQNVRALNDDWLVTSQRTLYKLFPDSKIGVFFDLGFGNSFVMGALSGDYGAFVVEDHNNYDLEIYNIKTGKLTRAWLAPMFAPRNNKICKVEFLGDNTLSVLYEPGPYAKFSEAVIGFYECEESTL